MEIYVSILNYAVIATYLIGIVGMDIHALEYANNKQNTKPPDIS